MASTTSVVTASSIQGKKFLDSIQSDLRVISNEAKKKIPTLKEAAEAGIVKIRSAAGKHNDLRTALLLDSDEILNVFIAACDTKHPKMVQTSLTSIQKLITFECLTANSMTNLVNCLWGLMEASVEELKLLQTIMLAVSTNSILTGESLARSITLCLRLNFTKNSTVNNAASATVRQLVSVVFERAMKQLTNTGSANDLKAQALAKPKSESDANATQLTQQQQQQQQPQAQAPTETIKGTLNQVTLDAYNLLNDLIVLVNAREPQWLLGLIEMTRTFGLELLEIIFTSYPEVFFRYDEFTLLVKQQVCPLIIKLLSPGLIKFRSFHQQQYQQHLYYDDNNCQYSDSSNNATNKVDSTAMSPSSSSTSQTTSLTSQMDKPFYSISIRLLRIVSVLVEKFYPILPTEVEVFISLLIKLLHHNKPQWQRVVSLEVLLKICCHATLVKFLTTTYDMSPVSSNVLKDLTAAIAVYIQLHFLPVNSPSGILSSIIGGISGTSSNVNSVANSNINSDRSSNSNGSPGSNSNDSSVQNIPGFVFKSTWLPLMFQLKSGQTRSTYLDQLDKQEVPNVPDTYGLTIAFHCMLELARAVVRIVDNGNNVLDLTNSSVINSSSASQINNVALPAPGSAVRSTSGAQSSISSSKMTNKISRRSSIPSDPQIRELNETLLRSTFSGLLGSSSILLETSSDEHVTALLLKIMEAMTSLLGLYELRIERECFTIAMCRSSLPLGYSLPPLVYKIPINPDDALDIGYNDTKLNDETTKGHKRNQSNCSMDLLNEPTSIHVILASNCTILQNEIANSFDGKCTPTGGSTSASIGSSINSMSNSNVKDATNVGSSFDVSDYRQQIVAVGTAMPTNGSSVTSSPVMLTAKNLQCMKHLLNLCQCHGNVLDESWYHVLLTIQHLVWILGLKPSTGGTLKSFRAATADLPGSGLVSNNSVVTDLPVLSAMLSRLFSSSLELDENSLLHLIDSLVKLSQDSMELAYKNREPSLFAVAKLLETSLINLPRLYVIWPKLTCHLIEVCRHPHSKMREWGAEAITTIILAIFTADESIYLPKSDAQNILLLPKSAYLDSLTKLSTINYSDIRQKQLEVSLQIIQSCGDSLDDNWPCILSIVSAIHANQNESLIRAAFQCLQVIISDYIQVVPLFSLSEFIDATTKFASQTADINVSLTAIGLIWNLADFLFQNETKIRSNLTKGVECTSYATTSTSVASANCTPTQKPDLAPYESLWLHLFTRLSELCIDDRPAVRKSSSQTLFGAFTSHSSILSPKIWQSIIWNVLFPLMRLVVEITETASDEKIQDPSKSLGIGSSNSDGSILLHHSRNTVYKQWSETHVITLNGISIVFSTYKHLLEKYMTNFADAWKLMLYHIESSAVSSNDEMSEASLKCFKLLLNGPVNDDNNELMIATSNKLDIKDHQPQIQVNINSLSPSTNDSFWPDAWDTWCRIGEKIAHNFDTTGKLVRTNTNTVTAPTATSNGVTGASNRKGTPSQAYLTAYMSLFSILFPNVKNNFTVEQLQRLTRIIIPIVTIPVDSTTEAYLVTVTATALESGNVPAPLTSLQEAVFSIINSFTNEFSTNSNTSSTAKSANVPPSSPFNSCFLPPLFKLLLKLFSYSCNYPSFAHPRYFDHSHPVHASMRRRSHSGVDPLAMNFVPLGESALRLAVVLYQNTAHEETVICSHVLRSIIQALRVPLALKYKCPSQTTWKLAVNSLITVLKIGLPVISANVQECLWADLAGTLEEFLFPSSKASPSQTLEDQQQDEAYDVKIVELVRDAILPHASRLPKEFVLQVVSILNKGSIHSATATSPVDLESNRKLREEFARTCFETLLKFSFLGPKGNPNLFINKPVPLVPLQQQQHHHHHHQQQHQQQSQQQVLQHAQQPLQLQNQQLAQQPLQQQNININQLTQPMEIGLVNKLAVASLLSRFNDVIVKFIEDEKLSGKCPLARHRVAEISFVLKALATLITSLKRAPAGTVEKSVWVQLIELYPRLVDCTTTTSAGQVNQSLKEVLREYQDLLQPPASALSATTTTVTATSTISSHIQQ